MDRSGAEGARDVGAGGAGAERAGATRTAGAVGLAGAVARAVSGWPVGTVAVGWLSFDGSGPGEARTAGATAAVLPWASVTKLATALAVLVAVEEGTTSLDEPAGPPGSTVRHLLAHASGLGPEPGPPVAAPAQKRIYSNAGYAALGAHVTARSGLPFATYLAEAVLGPLGMAGVRMDDPPAGLAAAGLSGTIGDLVALAGEWAAPTLVSGDTWRRATTVQWPDLAGILPGFGRFAPCPWGLGPEVRGTKHPHWTGAANAPATYGHFGSSGSFLWVDPVAGLAAVSLADRPFGPWAARAWPELADLLLDACAGGVEQV
jgi:CubicO group peptidase (beta-lactamase class C family)